MYHNHCTFTLDETYCLHIEGKDGRLRRDARLESPFYGEVEIAYNSTDDWWVKGITLSASNCKYGKGCEGWEEEIFANHPLWKPIERYLQEIASDDVADKIRADIIAEREDFRFQQGKDRARGLMY